jgi:hypothetical protein
MAHFLDICVGKHHAKLHAEATFVVLLVDNYSKWRSQQ